MNPKRYCPDFSASSRCIFTAILLSICVFSAPSCKSEPKERTKLRVNLFPWLPDAADDKFKGMALRIEREFETQSPNVDVEIALTQDNDFYNLESYKRWMNTFDVIEVDAVFLTNLVVPEELIEEWSSVSDADWQPPARTAARVNGKAYAIPHWMCGYFLFSRDSKVAEAKNIKELVAVLNATPDTIPEIAGNLNSSWGTPALYVDSWEDNYSPADPTQAISTSLDTQSIRSLKEFADQCSSEGKNPCLDKTYKDNALAQARFAKKEVETAFGYSESLFDILQSTPPPHVDGSIIISSLVLGNGSHPLFFMDGFVMPKGKSKEIKAAAAAFVKYMQRPETYTWIVMSQDAPGAPARYLIPATVSAFAAEPIKANAYYQTIQATLSNGRNFPNSGLPEINSQMRDAIISELQQPK